MTEKPIYAISVFTGEIKGYVKFSEELENNRIKIDLVVHFTDFTCMKLAI